MSMRMCVLSHLAQIFCPTVWCCQIYEWQTEKLIINQTIGTCSLFLFLPSCLRHFASHFFHLDYGGKFQYYLFLDFFLSVSGSFKGVKGPSCMTVVTIMITPPHYHH